MKLDDSDPLAATEVGSSAMDDTVVGASEPAGRPSFAPTGKIGRFTVIDTLGSGAMGVVVSAFDPELDRRIAIKMLHVDICHSHGVRLEREAKAMAQLNHPNVVTIHETGHVGDRLYIAMEYVAGTTLRGWLHTAPRARDAILDTMLQAGRGLAAAHAVGLVHRDFKPDNVLVGGDGRVRVSDFGLVTSAGGDDAGKSSVDTPALSLTQTGDIMGTPLYMAPEQHAGWPADAKADQFSFCVTLWQALCDDLPYGAGSYPELVENITGDKLKPVPRGSLMSPRLRAIIARGLSSDPAARFPSMTALISAIERVRVPRRWPYVVAGGAGAAAVAAVAIALAAATGGEREPCAGSELRLVGVWDGARRTAIATKLGEPVASALDRYTAAWVAHHGEVCRATNVRHEQSAELLDLRMHCLDERLTQLGPLLARFGEATSIDPYRALDAVGALPPLADCDDAQRLRAALPPPADPAQRDKLAALERRFAEIVSFDRLGQWKRARELLAPLEVEAKQLGYAPLDAKVVLLRAGEQYHDGDLDAAVASYREAAEVAARAKDDERIAQAWTDLVSVHAARGKYADALELAPIARAATERVSDHPLLGARFANALAGIYLAQGKYPDARVEYEHALELVRKDGTDNELVGPALTNLATVKWYVDDIAGAQKDFEDAGAWFVKRYGPDHPSLGYIERNIGDLAAHKGDLDGAIVRYEKSLAIFEKAHGPSHIDLTIALDPLCYAYAHTNQLAKARAAGERSLALRSSKLGADHPGNIATLSNLIDVDTAEGTPAALARAQGRVDHAMAIAEATFGTGGPQVAPVLERVAAIAVARGEPEKARVALERSLAVRIKAAGDHSNDSASAHVELGDVELVLRRYAEAIGDYTRAEQIFEAADPKDPDIARARFGRARALYATGHAKEAVELARAARGLVGTSEATKRLAADMDAWIAAPKN